ncbi:cytochrome c biogenesis protein [Gracilibacillus ureilyticus]|uniref:Cytochrome c biogenesis protein n=1 Tax=Gracilibacillus ureilyticus TaxID=531814 RepID=A0A1H9LSM5_9BACI|nr:cytochrome c biogenesis protein ResB [Gracilibacillus ureilyticus]SER14318.1 cytochrome c biogenesis protein [Gracilibacillus ureilyticus]
MNVIKCEACGYENSSGTAICNNCGKPLDKDNNTNLLNMRYDGRAIRSKTRNTSIVDKIWNFFSSIKVGVSLIAIALIASAIGTIFPQSPYIPSTVEPAVHYRDQYGIFGQIYYQLGFHELYSSWWYMILIALIGISIFIVSLDRGIPLYKALKNQNPKRHINFLKRQKLFGYYSQYSPKDYDTLKANLKKHRYKIYEKDGHILAEKGRFSRWGPYVNHTGLIIFLIGTLLHFVPYMYVDEFIWVREGETEIIPGTGQKYYVENQDFIFETYGDDEEDAKFSEMLERQGTVVAKHYETKAIIYKDTSEGVIGSEPTLEEVTRGSAIVNEPIKFDGFALYQSKYQLNEFQSMSFKLHETDDPEEQSLLEFTVDFADPERVYTFDNGFKIEINKYYPDYVLDDDGTPRSQTNYPRNPAFVFFVYPPGEEEPEVSFIGIRQNLDPSQSNQYRIGLTGIDVRDVSGLNLKKDLTLPVLGLGAFIFMIGVIQGMYWQHRRIWIHPENGTLYIASHTNKNWFGMNKEVEKIMQNTNFEMLEDQENKVTKDK